MYFHGYLWPSAGNREIKRIHHSDDRLYTNLTSAIPWTNSTASHVTTVFLDRWIVPYSIPDHQAAENGPQFVSKCLETICGFFGLKHLTTTAYHPQMNDQAEGYSKTMVDYLRHYVGEHQDK